MMRTMKWLARLAGMLAVCGAAVVADAVATGASAAGADLASKIETIVLIRHGEKPASGLGQLDCQGLNRALALPPVIATQFGRPAAIFAPSPAVMKPDGTGTYYYVRPLATIEPTAIALGLPVNAGIPYNDVKLLQTALLVPQLHGKLVLVAWEHKQIVDLTKQLLTVFHGNPAAVPAWKYDNFDGIYLVRINWAATPPSITFAQGQEGLNNLATSCPSPEPGQ
jgi:hypothetical protein